MWTAAKNSKMISKMGYADMSCYRGDRFYVEWSNTKKKMLTLLRNWCADRCPEKKKLFIECKKSLKTIEKRKREEIMTERWREIDQAKRTSQWWKALNKFRPYK